MRALGIVRRQKTSYTVNHKKCESVTMKNITVSVDEKTYRLSRIRAAELDTSVSALVRGYLRSLVGADDGGRTANESGVETTVELRRTELDEVLADFEKRGVGLRMADNLPREALYDRGASCAEADQERLRHGLAQ